MKLKQAAQSQPEKKNGRTPKLTALPEQVNEFAGVTVLPIGATGVGKNNDN